MHDISDKELFERWLEGDERVLEVLIARHLPAVWSIALAIVGSPDDAEDVCQQAFIRCWDRRHQCRDSARFRSWLLAIARNSAHSHLRGRKAPPVLATGDEVESRQASPCRVAQRSELRTILLRGIETLTPPQREVLLLRDLEGWPHEDIAQQLSISGTMSRRHLSDARKKMKEYLTEAGADDLRFGE